MALRRSGPLFCELANLLPQARLSVCAALPISELLVHASQTSNGGLVRTNQSSCHKQWSASAGHCRRLSTAADAVIYPSPATKISQPAPEFSAPAVIGGEIGKVSLSDYKGKWVVLFFYPKDFTFVCPTEIIAFSDRAKEFDAINAQLIAASTDTEETHLAWIKTPRRQGGLGYMQIPIIADTTKVISAKYGVLLEDKGIALRGLFVIDPKGVLRQITVNDLPIGRSVDEALRLVQALQFYEEHGEVCPADWKPGGKTMVADPEKSLEYFTTVHSQEDEQLGSKLVTLSTPAEFHQMVESGKPLVVDFYAPWCGKCRMIAPFLDELAVKYPGVTFAKLDTAASQLQDFSTSVLGIKALPAFRFYKGGRQIGEELTGYKKKPLEELVSQLV